MARREIPAWQSAPLWALLTGLGLAVGCLPRAVELALGRALGRLALLIDRKRARIAADNIGRCLPELSARARRDLLRRNFEHYGIVGLELLHIFCPIPGHYRRYCLAVGRLEGYEHWKRASDKGKGLLFASSHVGNWEFLGNMGALRGIPITIVTRRLVPPWLMSRIESMRHSVGVKAAYQPRTMPTVLKALRRGESVGFVIDQYAAPPAGMPAVFFGVEVDTLAAVGPLAQRTGAPIVPVSTVRGRDGIIRVRIEPELDFGADAGDAKKTTQALAAMVERWVRANPEQWLWGHRRFKNVKWPDEAAA